MDVYVVNGVPGRTERAETEAAKLEAGGEIHLVRAPFGAEAAERSFRPCRSWRNPVSHHLMTWGEVACMVGHYTAWERIARSGQSAIVVEDDVEVLGPVPAEVLREDLVYLAGKPLGKPGELVDGLQEAPYMWWLAAYWLTPAAAGRLIAALRADAVLPADDFVAYHCGHTGGHVDGELHQQVESEHLESWMLPEFCASQWSGEQSTTELAPQAASLRTVIFATDPSRIDPAWRELGYSPEVLGAGHSGWSTSGRGGMEKLHWLRQYLGSAPGSELVLAVDGYDTRPLVEPGEMIRRWAALTSGGGTHGTHERGRIAVGGEKTCWPDEQLAERFDKEQPYPYPCSGTIMGWADALAEHLDAGGIDKPSWDDDQLFVHWRCIRWPCTWKVDPDGYLFQALAGAERSISRYEGKVANIDTRVMPGIVHGNNGADMTLAHVHEWREPTIAADAYEWIAMERDILAMPFLDEESCRWICDYGDALDTLWQPLYGDAVPGDELRVKSVDVALYAWLQGAMDNRIAEIAAQYWRPATWQPVKDLFLIRYSASGVQADIRLHHDMSFFSCSIILQRAEAGGELLFPRQGWSDVHLPAGWLVCWPSAITHPHQVTPVRAGRRVSCVVWTGG